MKSRNCQDKSLLRSYNNLLYSVFTGNETQSLFDVSFIYIRGEVPLFYNFPDQPAHNTAARWQGEMNYNS